MCITGRASATMGAMNKRELAKAVAVQADVELKTVVTVIDGFTDVVTAVVSKGEPVSIPGFAKFVKVNRAARMGRNPATGEAIRIKASKKARITPVKAFKDAVLAPATAPKLVKGAYPTSRRRCRLRGQVRRPGGRQGSLPPRRHRHARRPASGRRRGRPRPSGPPPRRPRRGSERPGPRTGTELLLLVLRPGSNGRAACICGSGRSGGPVPERWPTGPWRSHITTGCRRTTPPTPRSSARTPRPSHAVPIPTSIPRSGLTVLSAGFLARRGSCCESGCRHCPYVS